MDAGPANARFSTAPPLTLCAIRWAV